MYINTFNAAMKQRFGQKVYKLALDGGFTCPNRDGTKGYGGCIFCSGSGSGDFAAPVCNDISTQIEQAKKLVQAKNKGGSYVAYFQNFTNTYAPVERLEELFVPAILHPDVAALSIATRPDCLEPEKIALLRRLNEIKPVWVELGLQTIHEQSARYIRRGYDLSVFDEAMRNLNGLETIVHMILGLPNETESDMVQTARYISQSGAKGIKLQLLHVIEGTDLCRDYRNGRFAALEQEEYIALLMACIRNLRPEIIIHRMTGDGAKKSLVAPLWSADKKRVLNAIQAAFQAADLVQGSAYYKE